MKNSIKIVSVFMLSLVMSAILVAAPFKNGKVIMVVTIEVNNFAEWKKIFDAGAPVREKAGIKVVSVCTATGNENQVIIIEEAVNAQSAHDFLALLKSKQKDGDMSKLDIKMYDKVE
ncbi:MAG: hypothetical protein V4667_01845 [Bacteroidota bacterium]